MSEEQYRVLMDLVMCSDPWPLSDKARGVVTDLMDEEAEARGYETWTDAYHALEPKQVV